MGQITDIQPGKRNPSRVNIYLDGKFAFAISRESKIVNKLKINDNLFESKIQELIFDDQVERLYEKAIKFLSYRPRSEKEVFDNLLRKLKLTDKGEDEKKNFQKSIEKVLEKLKKLEFLNDREFTTWWVEQRTKFKKTSPRIIKSELFKKGIDKEIIEEIFAKVEIDPFELALSSGRKKLNSYKNLDSKTFREKMSRFLASRGFDWEIVKRVVDTLAKEE
jgi:regulatory protein